MERMTGLDAGFLYTETPTTHMHTLKVAVLDTARVPGGYGFEVFRDVLASRLPLLPPFRRRVVEVPWQLNHPVWIDDPDFDLDRHLRRVVAVEGTAAEMDRIISEVASTPLDRSRPLWEITVIEGLDGGRLAAVAKIHHAMADGVAANALLANVMGVGEDHVDLEDVTDDFTREPIPSPGRLIIDALMDRLRTVGHLPALILRTIRNVVRMLRGRRILDVAPPTPIKDAPRTRFNVSLSARRVFASRSLPLSEVKAAKGAFDATVNDVVLCMIGGALRRQLFDHGEVPAKSLIAAVPISTDQPDAAVRLAGNKVSNLFTSLRTDIEDPVERLAAIHDVTGSAKQLQSLLGPELYEQWNEYSLGRPYAWFMQQYSGRDLANLHAPPINLVVSNVPGPEEPMSLAGARLVQMFSVGPILDGIGLNITVWSYRDQLNFSAIACADHLPDLAELLEHCESELASLTARAQR